MLKHVITICDGAAITGGTEKVAITTAIALAEMGLGGLYFAGEAQIDPGLQESVEVVTLGLADAYHTTSKAELLQRFFWNPTAAKKFTSAVRTRGFTPDDTIVHVHSFRRILSGSVVKAAKRLGFKVVFTLHDYGLVCPNTSFFEFPEQMICTRKPLSMGCYSCQCTHSGWPMKAMQMGRGQILHWAKVRKQFDHFLFVSEFSRPMIEPYLPPAVPKSVLRNPVSSIAEPQANLANCDCFTFVGRLSPEKGGVDFARAAKLAGVRCRFVGTGPEEEAIRAANPQAEMTGWVESSRVAELICSSRAVVMPSLWYETAGLSVIEALSRGVPVIVSDRCASVEYVLPNENGVVYNGRSIEALAEVLRTFDAEKAKSYGEAAYIDYWRKPLSIESHMDQLVGLYRLLLVDQ